MNIETIEQVRFTHGGSSIIHEGEYIFSAREARNLGYTEETEVYCIKKISYGKDENLQKAMEMMPDYYCWDSDRKVLIRTTEV